VRRRQLAKWQGGSGASVVEAIEDAAGTEQAAADDLPDEVLQHDARVVEHRTAEAQSIDDVDLERGQGRLGQQEVEAAVDAAGEAGSGDQRVAVQRSMRIAACQSEAQQQVEAAQFVEPAGEGREEVPGGGVAGPEQAGEHQRDHAGVIEERSEVRALLEAAVGELCCRPNSAPAATTSWIHSRGTIGAETSASFAVKRIDGSKAAP